MGQRSPVADWCHGIKKFKKLATTCPWEAKPKLLTESGSLAPKQCDKSEHSGNSRNKESGWGPEQMQNIMSYGVQIREEGRSVKEQYPRV